jgi:SPP1 family predicted phage head-tail adaptor
MRMIDPADLSRQVQFIAPTSAQDSSGENTPTWTNVIATVWAEIKPLTGRQLALAQANTITSTATHQVRVRYRTELVGQVNYRIQYAGGFTTDGSTAAVRYFRINSIVDTETAHMELLITATEVVS